MELGDRIYRSSTKGEQRWRDLVPTHLRNAATRLRRIADRETDPGSHLEYIILREAEEMEAYADQRAEEWEKEHG